MKLVYKNLLLNLIISVFILFVGEYSLYSFLKSKIEKEVTEHLYLEKHFMLQKIKRGINVNSFAINIGDQIDIKEISTIEITVPVIKDVEVKEEWEEEHFSSKQIIFDITQNNKFYRIGITKTIDQDEGLTGSMEAIIFISGLIMLIVMTALNILVYYKLFLPFNKLIKDVEDFSIQSLKKIIPQKTTTHEFKILGEKVNLMSEKIINDYKSAKEFTENITHEIQTPLAVINSKIERCIQDKNLTEEQAVLLNGITKAVNQLFNISKGLTLLAKLDNRQYTNLDNINLKELIAKRIRYFTDFIENKNLILIENYEHEVNIVMDCSLAEIMIDNIFKNAIMHNYTEGKILINITNGQLIISNTGEEPTDPTEEFFTRFYTQQKYKSLGLGLPIVKKITEYYDFEIKYYFKNQLHSICINFNKKQD